MNWATCGRSQIERIFYGCFTTVTALGGAVSFAIPYAPLALGLFLSYVLLAGLDIILGWFFARSMGVNDTPTLVKGIIRKTVIMILTAVLGIIFWSFSSAVGIVAPWTTLFFVKFSLGIFPSVFLATFNIAEIQSILEHLVANSKKDTKNLVFRSNFFWLLHKKIHDKTMKVVNTMTDLMSKGEQITSKDQATFIKLKKLIEEWQVSKKEINDLLED